MCSQRDEQCFNDLSREECEQQDGVVTEIIATNLRGADSNLKRLVTNLADNYKQMRTLKKKGLQQTKKRLEIKEKLGLMREEQGDIVRRI